MKRKPFKMRSGNDTPVYMMGSSPAKKDKPKKKKDFEPAYPGADYSQKEIDAMTEKEKEEKIDGYEPPVDIKSIDADSYVRGKMLRKKKKSPNKASQQAGAIIRRERHMI